MGNIKLKTKHKILIAIFIILVISLSLIVYVFPQVVNLFQDTYTLEYGTVTDGENVSYLVLRDETLYTSNNDGEVERLVKSNDLIRYGTSVVSVGGVIYSSDNRGIVSYYYDNLENDFDLSSLEGLKSDVIKEISKSFKNEENDSIEVSECPKSVLKGDPIYKIINNDNWYLVTWMSKEKAANLYVGKNVTVKFSDESSTSMTVGLIYQEENETEVVLYSNHYFEGYDKLRIGDATIITKSISGLVIETDSIVTLSDGTVGVYILTGTNDKVFVPINILLSGEKETVVSRNYFYDQDDEYVYTVKMYDTVLRKHK